MVSSMHTNTFTLVCSVLGRLFSLKVSICAVCVDFSEWKLIHVISHSLVVNTERKRQRGKKGKQEGNEEENRGGETLKIRVTALMCLTGSY